MAPIASVRVYSERDENGKKRYSNYGNAVPVRTRQDPEGDHRDPGPSARCLGRPSDRRVEEAPMALNARPRRALPFTHARVDAGATGGATPRNLRHELRVYPR